MTQILHCRRTSRRDEFAPGFAGASVRVLDGSPAAAALHAGSSAASIRVLVPVAQLLQKETQLVSVQLANLDANGSQFIHRSLLTECDLQKVLCIQRMRKLHRVLDHVLCTTRLSR